MPTLTCCLLREDGEWYALGENRLWRAAFETFPGPANGSVTLERADEPLLALRLSGHGYDAPTCEIIAADIIRWCQRVPAPRHWATSPAYSMRFVTELDPEIEPDVLPSPITGSVAHLLRK